MKSHNALRNEGIKNVTHLKSLFYDGMCFISREGVEHCVRFSDNASQIVDMAFNVGFMIYFLIRVRLNFVHFI